MSHCERPMSIVCVPTTPTSSGCRPTTTRAASSSSPAAGTVLPSSCGPAATQAWTTSPSSWPPSARKNCLPGSLTPASRTPRRRTPNQDSRASTSSSIRRATGFRRRRGHRPSAGRARPRRRGAEQARPRRIATSATDAGHEFYQTRSASAGRTRSATSSASCAATPTTTRSTSSDAKRPGHCTTSRSRSPTRSRLLAAADLLASHGVKLIWGPGRHGVGHNMYTYHHDPDGNIVELFCRPGPHRR